MTFEEQGRNLSATTALRIVGVLRALFTYTFRISALSLFSDFAWSHLRHRGSALLLRGRRCSCCAGRLGGLRSAVDEVEKARDDEEQRRDSGGNGVMLAGRVKYAFLW